MTIRKSLNVIIRDKNPREKPINMFKLFISDLEHSCTVFEIR